MLVLDDARLAPLLDWPYLIGALAKGHASGMDRVERLLVDERQAAQTNHLLLWPAWKFGLYCGVKIVTTFPGNPARGLPTNTSVYVLFDGRDGHTLMVCEGAELTLRKTAADSALAASHLARASAANLLMIGAGRQAPYQIAALCAVRPSIRRIMIWNRTQAAADTLAALLRAQGQPAEVCSDLGQGLEQADIISAATASTAPLIEGVRLRPGVHVDLVGGFTPAMREADDTAMRRGRLFVDTRQFTLTACGDLAQAIASGAIEEGSVEADLFELVGNPSLGRGSAAEITIFKNAGGGHLDLMTAAAAYARASGLRPD
jgi:alanine dehydrogenase